MKYIPLIVSSLAVALATGCSQIAKEQPVQTYGSAMKQQLDKPNAATTDAELQMLEFAAAQKAEFVSKVHEAILARIEKLGDVARAESTP